MAYTANDFQIQVRGTTGAYETWVNRWTVLYEGVGTPSPEALASSFNTFYSDIGGFASWLSDEWTHVGATVKELLSGDTSEASWSPGTGSATGDFLPTQLALRISLTSPNAHGGPYLCGFVEVASGADGRVASGLVTDFTTAIGDLRDNLAGDDFALAIDRPTVPETQAAFQARIGQRWDVIRKRANDSPEAYSVITL